MCNFEDTTFCDFCAFTDCGWNNKQDTDDFDINLDALLNFPHDMSYDMDDDLPF